MKEISPNEELSGLLEVIDQRQAAVSASRDCSLSDYRGHVGHLPRPSDEQIEDYVQFVCRAHSWYKHLPFLPPGEPFRFFVDPLSGYDRMVQRDGSVICQERTDTSPRAHYTWMTTKEYRRRFACLAYAQDAAPDFFVQSHGSTRECADLPIFVTPDGAYRISPQVAEVGLVELTSLIHPKMARSGMWFFALRYEARWELEGQSRQWPQETGGEETLRQIKEVCARAGWWDAGETDALAVRTGGWDPEETDHLASLVLPERRRLQKNMTEAINRMLALLYD